MKISILGASGGTGQAIVRLALQRGHEVTALVRRPEALTVAAPKLAVLAGDARDAKTIDKLVAGHDAIVCSLGITVSDGIPNADVRPDVCAVSTKLLFETMPRHGVRRIVLMSTHGAGKSNDRTPYVVRLRNLMQGRVCDKDDMEEFIASSSAPVDWTVIRNPVIYAGTSGHAHDVYARIELNRSSRISQAALAAFAIAEVETPKYVGRFLTITESLDDTALMAKAERAKPS
jgi:putative NADH-flavin reductase